jgi:hypothetical protein
MIEENPLTWNIFDWRSKQSDKIIWYAWYFLLYNRSQWLYG